MKEMIFTLLWITTKKDKMLHLLKHVVINKYLRMYRIFIYSWRPWLLSFYMKSETAYSNGSNGIQRLNITFILLNDYTIIRAKSNVKKTWTDVKQITIKLFTLCLYTLWHTFRRIVRHAYTVDHADTTHREKSDLFL